MKKYIIALFLIILIPGGVFLFNYLKINKTISEETLIKFSGNDSKESVTQSLTLAKIMDGYNIEWQTSAPTVISETGLVYRAIGENQEVTLIASISNRFVSLRKRIILNVLQDKNTAIGTPDISVQDLEVLNRHFGTRLETDYDGESLVSITGVYRELCINSADSALESLCGIRNLLGIDNPYADLTLSNASSDEFGRQYTFNQVKNGVPVYGRSVTVCSDTAGMAYYLRSGLLRAIGLRINKPEIGVNDIIKSVIKEKKAINEATFALRIYSINDHKDSPVLSYVFTMSGIEKSGDGFDETSIYDADTGALLLSLSNIIT